MVELKEFVKRVDRVSSFFKDEMKKQERLIVSMQRSQHHAGTSTGGEKIQSGYSTGYSKRRKNKGLQTSFVDLHFTGKMHKGLKVLPVKGGVDIRSKEPYEHYVRGNFPGSFGLTENNAESLAEKLAVSLKKYLVA